MSIRNIREIGDDILRKRSKEVKEMTPRLQKLVDDMLETMYQADGVGLAAPQVGILRRIFVADVSEEKNQPIVMINPELIEASGSQTGEEGCLSVPGKHATVTRASHVRFRAQNTEMKPFEIEADGLLARCLLHENDHLDGILYVDKKEGPLKDNEEEEYEED